MLKQAPRRLIGQDALQLLALPSPPRARNTQLLLSAILHCSAAAVASVSQPPGAYSLTPATLPLQSPKLFAGGQAWGERHRALASSLLKMSFNDKFRVSDSNPRKQSGSTTILGDLRRQRRGNQSLVGVHPWAHLHGVA